jgi:hypothetical protein
VGTLGCLVAPGAVWITSDVREVSRIRVQRAGHVGPSPVPKREGPRAPGQWQAEDDDAIIERVGHGEVPRYCGMPRCFRAR